MRRFFGHALTTTTPADDGSPPSAFGDFLGRTTVYDMAKGAMPADLVQFGLLGSAVLVAAGIVAVLLPSPASIGGGGFFLLFSQYAAAVAGLLQSMAVVAIVSGILLFALDLYLMQAHTTQRWRLLVVGQAAMGGLGGAVGVAFLALFLLNLAIWAAIVALGLAVLSVMLAAFAGG